MGYRRLREHVICLVPGDLTFSGGVEQCLWLGGVLGREVLIYLRKRNCRVCIRSQKTKTKNCIWEHRGS